jgi:hypothetical protein
MKLRSRTVDLVIGALLFAGSAVWGFTQWHRLVANGQPFYYQTYFEPALMIACGKGFVIAQQPVPAITAFLAQQQDHFSCDAIPADTVLGTSGMYQGAWRYLLLTVGTTWRVLGISWKGLGPLFGVLFAATITAVYAICRLAMVPLLALLCASGLCVSQLQLVYLPVLRDYAKAPFTLALIFVLGLLVTKPPSRKRVLSIAMAYGVILGVGYGFRSDFLASIPPFFIAVTLFLDGGLRRNWRLKSAACLVCTITFVVTAWPVIRSVSRTGGCQWHTVLLGFPTGFSRPLGIVEGPYKHLRVYSDNFVYATVTSYAARLHPDVGHIGYCDPTYDAATGRYFMDLAAHFPADMIARAYASTLRIVELPFSWGRTRQEYFDVQFPDPAGAKRYGATIIVAALVLATIGSVRIGLFLMFFLLYFGGYPALQFHARHYFHLEFISWWAGGFVLHSLALRTYGRLATSLARAELVQPLRRAAVTFTAAVVLLTSILWAARAYQQTNARRLFEAYLAMQKEPVPLPHWTADTVISIPRTAMRSDPETADVVQIDVNRWLCGDRSTITLRYDQSVRREFARRIAVGRDDSVQGPTRIVTPVYDHFTGVELSDMPAGCVQSVARARPPVTIPLLLEVVLPPRWRTTRLYQRFGEVGPPELDAVQ